ncbi:hypothetical protein [Streptomyces avicenniae]|uniref:hypothetical protein n=1 Tax=Streptomyces avicenniae TaxID=500153 RepID=UPI00069BFE3C|nr:hypothetical protein [Streptomyces avicenniae]
MKKTRLATAAMAALTVLTAAGLTTACDVQQAVDCARLSLAITGNVNDIQQAVNDNDPDAFEAATDELQANIDELHGMEDAEVQEVGDSVADAADTLQVDAEGTVQVDLQPITDAAGQLTEVCS